MKSAILTMFIFIISELNISIIKINSLIGLIEQQTLSFLNGLYGLFEIKSNLFIELINLFKKLFHLLLGFYYFVIIVI